MDTNNQDGSEVLETTEETVAEQEPQVTEEPTEEEAPDEEKEALRKELEETKQKNKQLYERLKKADTPKSDDQLSSRDVLALAKSNIAEDDMDEVLRMAKILGKPVAEALKDNAVKAILDTRNEERKTAQATQTSGRRGTATPTGEDFLKRAESKNEIPDTEEGMKAMIQAGIDRRKRK